MINEIKKLEKVLQKYFDLPFSEIAEDSECEAYFGFNFKINDFSIKFRKSKLTPKKVGQFVTLWKRNADGNTIPFDVTDDFDFYIVHIEEDNHSGFFLFPKAVLEKHQILTSNKKEGKRGFRIYADWHFPNNKQAEKTKQWQTEFFIDYSCSDQLISNHLKNIFEL